MKRLSISELREKLSESEEKTITDAYLKGLSRDKTALIVKKNKNIIQDYFEWLSLSDDYTIERNKAKSNIKRTKNELSQHDSFEKFRDLYLQGASVLYIKDNVHISTDTVSEYIKQLPPEEIKLHYESINNNSFNRKFRKEIEKEYNIKNISDFFGREVENRQFDVYGRIDFLNPHFLFNYKPDGTVDSEDGHITEILTKGIKSKGDFVVFLDIISKYRNDLDPTSQPYIHDFKRNRTYSVLEYADIIGVKIE